MNDDAPAALRDDEPPPLWPVMVGPPDHEAGHRRLRVRGGYSFPVRSRAEFDLLMRAEFPEGIDVLDDAHVRWVGGGPDAWPS